MQGGRVVLLTLLGIAILVILAALFLPDADAQEAPVCLAAAEKLKDAPETWDGGNTRDSVTGLRGDDNLFAGDGNDFVNGGRDNDTVDGGEGNDTLCGGRGNDRITGAGGDDLIYGEEENDWVDAGTGNDRILGSAMADDLYAGEGDDIIAGGGGLSNDTLDAGEGYDLCIVGENDTTTGCEAFADHPRLADSDERPHEVGAGEHGATAKISLTLSPFGANGTVRSSRPACRANRHIRFNTYEFGYISVRLDETSTNDKGEWSLQASLPPALYFAQLDASPRCRYAVSPTLPL